MNVSVAHVRNALRDCYSTPEVAAMSRIVCCEMLGQSAVDYYLGKDMILSSKEASDLEDILSRLRNFEPIQYVQGKARFLGRDFRVTPAVLIPRPETEELVETMLKEVSPDARILDIGTGSGCIAISLSKELPSARVDAWDISEEALDVARENSVFLGASVCFLRRNALLYSPDAGERYDVIVSNPPYVTDSERKDMERNVLDWEPGQALFVPDADPLLFYQRIADLGRTMLLPGGRLYFEINRRFGNATVGMLRERGYSHLRILKDISGNDRIVIAEL